MAKKLGLPDQPSWKVFFILFGVMFVLTIAAALTLKNFRQEMTDLKETSRQLAGAVGQGGQILDDLENGLDSLVANAETARQRGFATRAQGCMQLVVDNDRSFDLTPACTAPEIAAYYPSGMCELYFRSVPECGSKFESSAL